MFRRNLTLGIAIFAAITSIAAAANTVNMGQGAGTNPAYIAVPPSCAGGVNYAGGIPGTWSCVSTHTATSTATNSPTATATATTTATQTATATQTQTPTPYPTNDTINMGLGVLTPPSYVPLTDCPLGIAYSTGSHAWICAPTPTATLTATNTQTATATATNTSTVTPTATATSTATGINRQDAGVPSIAEMSGDGTTSGSNALIITQAGAGVGPFAAGNIAANQGANIKGGLQSTGSINISQIATATAPTIISGSAGSSFFYWCVNEDGLSHRTAVSPSTGTTTNTVTMRCPGTTGAIVHDLLRTAVNVTPSGTGSYFASLCTSTSGLSCNATDGGGALSSFTVPTTNQTGSPYIQGYIDTTEVAAPSGVASHDILWGDSTAHRFEMLNNNGSAVQVVASGVDINTSDQVTATHLASALPVNQGGIGATTTSQNFMFAGPTSGSGAPGFRLLVGADLPVPSASTLGGVESLTCGSTTPFLASINTSGVPVCMGSATTPNFDSMTVNGATTNGSGTIASTASSNTDLLGITATNTSAGASADTAISAFNDLGHRVRLVITGSGSTDAGFFQNNGLGGFFISQQGAANVNINTNGVTRLTVNSDGGIYTNNASGTTKGVDTLNVGVNYYKNGVLISNGTCQGTSASIALNTTDFIGCGELPGLALITAEANAQTIAPCTGVLSNLYVKVTTAASAANPPVITVDNATVGSTLTCTINNSGTSTTTTCNDITHHPAITAGDLLSVKVANPLLANATGVIQVAYQMNCGG